MPVFGLIALGYAAGRSGYGSAAAAAAKALPEFVFRIAMPLMLFRTVGTAQFPIVPPMPVGSNASLFAAAYQQEEAAGSGAIALSTPLARVTLTLLLPFLPGRP